MRLKPSCAVTKLTLAHGLRPRLLKLRPGLANLASGMVVASCHTSPVSVDYRSIIFQRTGKPQPRRHDRHLRAIVDG